MWHFNSNFYGGDDHRRISSVGVGEFWSCTTLLAVVTRKWNEVETIWSFFGGGGGEMLNCSVDGKDRSKDRISLHDQRKTWDLSKWCDSCKKKLQLASLGFNPQFPLILRPEIADVPRAQWWNKTKHSHFRIIIFEWSGETPSALLLTVQLTTVHA